MDEVEVLRDEADKQQFDASVIIGQKPGKYYRWARNTDMNLIRRRFDGYEICRDKDIKSALNASTRMKKGEEVDDTITLGDLILVETTIENHERLMEMDRRKILRRTKGVMSTFRSKVAGAGGKPFEEHGKSPDKEGKGYDKGYTENDLARDLAAMPENQTEQRSWRRREE